MLDKVAYSIIWMAALLWLTNWVFHHDGTGWDIAYGALFVFDIVQLGLVCYNISDWHSRRRMWNAMKGNATITQVPALCPHGIADWDDCPDCRH